MLVEVDGNPLAFDAICCVGRKVACACSLVEWNGGGLFIFAA